MVKTWEEKDFDSNNFNPMSSLNPLIISENASVKIDANIKSIFSRSVITLHETVI